MKIKSYKELVNSLINKTDKEKIIGIEQFFLNNIEYYYPKILWNDYKKSIYKKEDFCSVKQARDEIFQEKKEEINNYFGIENPKIIKLREEFLKIFLKNCKSEYGNKPFINSNISWNMMLNVNKVYKVDGFYTEKNGLFKKGTNIHFAKFVKKICDDLGLRCQIVNGFTLKEHCWNLIEFEGKKYHFDLTYALFVRDHFKTWGKKNLVPEDFLMVDEETLQNLSPRTIDSQECGKI